MHFATRSCYGVRMSISPSPDPELEEPSLIERIEADRVHDAQEAIAEVPNSVLGQVGHFIRNSGKRIAVAIVGGAVLAAGVAMMVLPGPGIVVILAGLGILATEFAWAKTALDKAKRQAEKAKQKVRRK